MHLPVFTLEEDVNALPALLPTPETVARFAGDLKAIQASTTHFDLQRCVGCAFGYVQALSDMGRFSDAHKPRLLDKVWRAEQRCAIK